MAVFLLFPNAFDNLPNDIATAAAFALVLLATLVVDFFANETIWLSVKPVTHVMYAGFFVLLWFVLPLELFSKLMFLLVSFILLLGLASDAISNSQRWKILIGLIGFYWVSSFVVSYSMTTSPGKFEWPSLPPTIVVYGLIPLLASQTRLFFPRTKDLLHTSLDYPPVRVDVLSYGMKRPAAVGIKRA